MATVFARGGKSNRNGYYYIAWRDHNGKRRSKCAMTSDKAAAERIANKLETDAALRRDRVIDPALDAISKEAHRPISEHLADFEAKLRAANRTQEHVERKARMIRQICDAAGFALAIDIKADGVNHYASRLRDGGQSARTIQAHLTAVKSFSKWLAENHKLPRDPLASVRKPDPKADRRRERRMLLPEEWHWPKAATAGGPDRCGMTGAERVLLYETAIQTGLRSNELRSLTRGRLFLDGDKPFITCKAGSTKNKKLARQYIPIELAEHLRAHIATKAPQAPVFSMPHETNVAGMLRDDLAEARRQWLQAANGADDRLAREQTDFLADVNHDGEVFDFHGLRHTCGAWLALAGIHPKVVQTVMRHSSITLTLDHYGHLFPGQEADAVARLQEAMQDSPEALQATGTAGLADAATAGGAQRVAQRAEREPMLTRAMRFDGGENGAEDENSLNTLQIATLPDGKRRSAEIGPEGFEPPTKGL